MFARTDRKAVFLHVERATPIVLGDRGRTRQARGTPVTRSPINFRKQMPKQEPIIGSLAMFANPIWHASEPKSDYLSISDT